MDSRYMSFPGGNMKKKRLDLPLWADDINVMPSSSLPDCVIIRTRLDEMDWIIIVSETSSAIKTTALGFDSFSDGRDGAWSGYILHRSLPKAQKSTARC